MAETNEQRYIREGRYTTPTDHAQCDPPHYEATCYLHNRSVDHSSHPSTCDYNHVAATGRCHTSVRNNGVCRCATATFVPTTVTRATRFNFDRP